MSLGAPPPNPVTSFGERWHVVHASDTAEALHRFDSPLASVPTVVVASVSNTALVLGSTQADAVVDLELAARLGQAVVRRRSGGGSVLVSPGRQVWLDVWIPRGDPLWEDDVVAQAIPVGAAWASALTAAGVHSCAVHHGGLERSRWSELVCFAGRGPGEVFASDGRKLVGISQRRTREWVRLQTMVYRHWDSAASLGALVLSDEERTAALLDLDSLVGAIGPAAGAEPPEIWERVVAALP